MNGLVISCSLSSWGQSNSAVKWDRSLSSMNCAHPNRMPHWLLWKLRALNTLQDQPLSCCEGKLAWLNKQVKSAPCSGQLARNLLFCLVTTTIAWKKTCVRRKEGHILVEINVHYTLSAQTNEQHPYFRCHSYDCSKVGLRPVLSIQPSIWQPGSKEQHIQTSSEYTDTFLPSETFTLSVPSFWLH